MGEKSTYTHPYIPNSAPEIKAYMLQQIGVPDVETLYQEIPMELRLKRSLNLPKGLLSEYEL